LQKLESGNALLGAKVV